MTKQPFISIIIVNFNGRSLLQKCLGAVYGSNYPKDKYEVIVVDNASRDDSASFVSRKFPQVKLIELSENKGFAGGNIAGYEQATGEYIVLLNNDTEVDKNWLKYLVIAAEPKTVGLVSPKLYLATPFIKLTLNSDIIPHSEISQDTNFSPVGLILENVTCRNDALTNLVWYKSGFYDRAPGPILMTRWTKGEAKILVPFVDSQKEEYVFTIHGYPTLQKMSTPLSIRLGDEELITDTIHSNQVKQFTISITRKQAENKLERLIQNAGNVVLHDGYSKDRGSVTQRTPSGDYLEFYEEDSRHFNKPIHLLSVCGACCLIKRAVIEQVGFFDPYYFMYYEDVDLSLRAWRMGWDILYEPRAMVNHHHRASTNQIPSSFFIYMVEKNHLAFTLVHFPLSTFIKQFVRFWIRTSITTAKAMVFRFRDNMVRFDKWNTLAEGRLKAGIYILKHLPRLFKNKLFWSRAQKRGYAAMKELLY